MRLKTKITAVFVISFLFIGSTVQKNKLVRVMTWNIWHGGLHGDRGSEYKKDPANTVNILKVLKQENADILFMQETYCCGMDIAKQAGYPYSSRGSTNLSIHSKYEIIDTIKIYKPFNCHGVVIAVEGKKILCINLWLHYLPDYFQDVKTMSPASLINNEGTTRLKEIRAILNEVNSLKKKLKIPVIIGGDFNSGSHLDWVESTRSFHYNKVIEWPVSKMMTDRGYIDSFREVNPDPVKTMEGTWGFLSDGIISDRIDYIYYRGDGIQAKNSRIVKDDPVGGFFNSDHRAILTVFEIKN